MFLRTLIFVMMLPTVLAIPPRQDNKTFVCVEAFRFTGGRIFVYKSEILLPANHYEVMLYGNTIRRKRVWIEIYVATPWGIKLLMIVNGRIIPATSETYDFSGADKELFK